MKCGICGERAIEDVWGLCLCDRHTMEYELWRSRWIAATGFRGELKIKAKSVVRMLRNNDALRSIKAT